MLPPPSVSRLPLCDPSPCVTPLSPSITPLPLYHPFPLCYSSAGVASAQTADAVIPLPLYHASPPVSPLSPSITPHPLYHPLPLCYSSAGAAPAQPAAAVLPSPSITPLPSITPHPLYHPLPLCYSSAGVAPAQTADAVRHAERHLCRWDAHDMRRRAHIRVRSPRTAAASLVLKPNRTNIGDAAAAAAAAATATASRRRGGTTPAGTEEGESLPVAMARRGKRATMDCGQKLDLNARI